MWQANVPSTPVNPECGDERGEAERIEPHETKGY